MNNNESIPDWITKLEAFLEAEKRTLTEKKTLAEKKDVDEKPLPNEKKPENVKSGPSHQNFAANISGNSRTDKSTILQVGRAQSPNRQTPANLSVTKSVKVTVTPTVVDPSTKSITKPSVLPVTKPIVLPVTQSVTQPVLRVSVQPATRVPARPVLRVSARPPTHPATQSVHQATAEPLLESKIESKAIKDELNIWKKIYDRATAPEVQQKREAQKRIGEEQGRVIEADLNLTKIRKALTPRLTELFEQLKSASDKTDKGAVDETQQSGDSKRHCPEKKP